MAADPSAVIIPGAQAASEDNNWIDGIIASCVEASMLVMLHVYDAATWATNAASDTWLVRAMQGKHLADRGGLSNWARASTELTALGLPNQAYGPQWFGSHSTATWTGMIQQAVNAGEPVLFGVPNASVLQDTWSGTRYDAGVGGHALTIVGYDSTGWIVADPNSGPAASGGFVHYTTQNLIQAGANSMVIPTTPPPLSLAGPGTLGGPSVPGGTPLDLGSAILAFPQTAITDIESALKSGQAIGVDLTNRALLLVAALIIGAIGLIVLFRAPAVAITTSAVKAAK